MRSRQEGRSGFAATALVVAAYALAMAYLEAAVVVYLRRALGAATQDVFPLLDPTGASGLAWIELGREAATLVMLASVGWLAGRQGLERFVWFAVAFGIWDIGYYGWLWVFSGWPSSLETWDLLFLLPVPWAGPVWSPVGVSIALIAFGLAAARRLRAGLRVRVAGWQLALALAGGGLVLASFMDQAPAIVDGGVPVRFDWPLYALGMAIASVAAWLALSGRPIRRRLDVRASMGQSGELLPSAATAFGSTSGSGTGYDSSPSSAAPNASSRNDDGAAGS